MYPIIFWEQWSKSFFNLQSKSNLDLDWTETFLLKSQIFSYYLYIELYQFGSTIGGIEMNSQYRALLKKGEIRTCMDRMRRMRAKFSNGKYKVSGSA